LLFSNPARNTHAANTDDDERTKKTSSMVTSP
jgi:hypothetical protein